MLVLVFVKFLSQELRTHAEIYRNKLEQCVADGTLDDEDVKNLVRLRVLLCIPQDVVDSAHAEICGRIFTKVLLLPVVCICVNFLIFCQCIFIVQTIYICTLNLSLLSIT